MAELTAEEKAALEAEKELKANTRKEVLRDLSKELGINAFDPNEVKEKFKEYDEFKKNQLTEQERLEADLKSYKEKEEQWAKKETTYEAKFKAIEIGIDTEKIDKALKLADGNVDLLGEVAKEFPSLLKPTDKKEKKQVEVNLNQNKNKSNKDEVPPVLAAWRKKRGIKK